MSVLAVSQRRPSRKTEAGQLLRRSESLESDRRLDGHVPDIYTPTLGHDFSRVPVHADVINNLPLHPNDTAPAAAESDWPSGDPLEPTTRSSMEARLGHDFSSVRVHSDQSAAQSAHSIGAHAFTVGDHVVLGATAGPLHTRQGQHVLAHELVHVVQQRLGGYQPSPDPESASERDANAAASAIALGKTPAPISRGTAVGIARQPQDPRHARGHAGEQGMGFELYPKSEGWIFFEGPSGSAGHGVTTSGFDGIAYNTRTGELHLLDNKSLRTPGNVSSATAIDPSKNLSQNIDTLITRVEAAKDVRGRIRILGLLRRTKAALAAGKPPPEGVKLMVTSVGGRTTDVSARLKGLGVEHHPGTLPKAAAPAATVGTPSAPGKQASAAEPSAPKAAAQEAPSQAVPPAEAPHVSAPAPEVIPVPGASPAEAPHVSAPAVPKIAGGGPPAAPQGSPLKAGLKAGAVALGWMLAFAGLNYLVHRKVAKDLESNLEQARRAEHGFALYLRAHQPAKYSGPVYLQLTIHSEEYSRYIPLVGWMPEAPVLEIGSETITTTGIETPIVTVDDHSLDLLRPGKTTEVTYTELLLP
jgi:uncharacterized protein DUF4157